MDRKSLLSSKQIKTKYQDSMIRPTSASNSLIWGTATPTAPEQKLIQQSNAAQNVLRTWHSSKTNSQKQAIRRIFRTGRQSNWTSTLPSQIQNQIKSTTNYLSNTTTNANRQTTDYHKHTIHHSTTVTNQATIHKTPGITNYPTLNSFKCFNSSITYLQLFLYIFHQQSCPPIHTQIVRTNSQ